VGNVSDLGLVKGELGGFLAHRGRGSSPTVGGVFAGRNRQAILDKHPVDDPRLYSRHRSRGVGNSEVLTGYTSGRGSSGHWFSCMTTERASIREHS
jgi:hypothetical protein